MLELQGIPEPAAATSAAACGLCMGSSEPVGRCTILGQYDAVYRVCARCGLMQVANPLWLKDDIDPSVAASDTGNVRRNLQMSQFLTVFLRLLGIGDKMFLDYAGGSGLLTRLMRDAGFDFRHYDPFTPNLFARGFEHSGEPIHGLTAFELLEHIADPKAFWDEVVRNYQPKILIASTECYRLPFDPDWWYLSRDTGQHVSFYSPRTFQYLAERYNLHYTRIATLHILARRRVPPSVVRMALTMPRFVVPLFRRHSLTDEDFRPRAIARSSQV